jgi:hypothetical protein
MSTEQISPQQQTIDDLMKILDNYVRNNKITGVCINEDIAGLLDINRDELKVLSSEECGENAVLLAKYAYYIQQLCNRESTSLHITEECLNKIISKNYAAFKGQFMKEDEVKMRIIEGNDAAQEYNSIKVLAKARVTQLSFLANRVQFMAQTFLELQQSKRKTYLRNQ